MITPTVTCTLCHTHQHMHPLSHPPITCTLCHTHQSHAPFVTLTNHMHPLSRPLVTLLTIAHSLHASPAHLSGGLQERQVHSVAVLKQLREIHLHLLQVLYKATANDRALPAHSGVPHSPVCLPGPRWVCCHRRRALV